MYCIYHKDDLDGICSAAIIDKHTKEYEQDCKFIGLSYSELDSFVLPELEKEEKIWVVDFSLKEKDMLKLIEQKQLVWIDHHQSSINKFKNYTIPGSLSSSKAACELTWDYLYDSYAPSSIRYLSSYDIWDHKDERILPFQYGMRLKEINYDSKIWSILLNSDDSEYPSLITTLLEAGEIILEYQMKEYKKYAEGAAFEGILRTYKKDYKVLACNQLFGGSKVVESKWDPQKHDCMMLFGWRKNKWQVSFYTNNSKNSIDCAELAEKFGGGGHKAAAGCILNDLSISNSIIILEE